MAHETDFESIKSWADTVSPEADCVSWSFNGTTVRQAGFSAEKAQRHVRFVPAAEIPAEVLGAAVRLKDELRSDNKGRPSSSDRYGPVIEGAGCAACVWVVENWDEDWGWEMYVSFGWFPSKSNS